MMRIRLRARWILTALIVAVVLALVACAEEEGEAPQATQSEASPTLSGTAEPTGEIVTPGDILRKDPNVTKRAELEWGWMFEQSGPLQGFGEPAGDGVLMAVQEVNDAGGFQVGDTIYTIKLVRHDTRSDVAITVAVATELVLDENVKVIWGPASVGDPESTGVTQQARVLQLCPCPQRELTSLSSVEQARDESRWAFQTLPAPSKFLPPGARNLVREHPEFDTFATICANSETGKTFCQFFEDAYKAAGFEHVGRELFPSETADFSPFLTKLKRGDPDIILNFVDAGPEQFLLLRQSWQLDLGEYYISVAVPYELFEGLVGTGIREKIVSAGAAPRTHAIYTSEKARQFFEEKYKPFKGGNLPPAAFAALLTYDPAYMLIAAMQRAGTVEDTDQIAAALEEVHFNGVGEDDYFFDERHILVSGVDSCTMFGGRYVGCVHNPPPTETVE